MSMWTSVSGPSASTRPHSTSTVVTPMTEVIRGPKFGAQTMARIPLGRYAETGDVAPSVCFLLAPGANYITGKNLTIDGGMTAM